MKKNAIYTIIAVLVAIITATITAIVFNTRFAKLTVDIWAFGVAIFLVIEAFYRINASEDTFWPRQFMRFIRIIIGASILTIHICQVIYGI